MTTLNTIIEEENTPDTEHTSNTCKEHVNTLHDNTPDTEWEDEFYQKFVVPKDVFKDLEAELAIVRYIKRLLTSRDTYWKEEMKKARQDWLRSEIEKLEGKKKQDTAMDFGDPNSHYYAGVADGHNQALSSIITRYKEELKVLEKQ